MKKNNEKRLLLLIIILFISKNIFAKENTVKDTTKIAGWHPEALVGLNISQIALKNWSQGGDNSLTWTIKL